MGTAKLDFSVDTLSWLQANIRGRAQIIPAEAAIPLMTLRRSMLG
jgi:hypothetical protein